MSAASCGLGRGISPMWGFPLISLRSRASNCKERGYLLTTSGFDKSAAGRAAPSAPWQDAQYRYYVPAPGGGERAVHQPVLPTASGGRRDVINKPTVGMIQTAIVKMMITCVGIWFRSLLTVSFFIALPPAPGIA